MKNKRCDSCRYYVAAKELDVMPGPFTGFCIRDKKGKVNFAYKGSTCYHFLPKQFSFFTERK